MTWTIHDSVRLATRAHRGQVDKAGQPYLLHPMAVARGLMNVAQYWEIPREARDTAYHVALLHDVLEDSHYTQDDLHRMGVPPEVVEAVVLLSRNLLPNEPYYPRIRANKIALAVKIADIQHNLDAHRLSLLSRREQRRLRARYAKALEALVGLGVAA